MLDVLILGAGVSGLAAAREFARMGMSFEVWEARDRIGGRVLTRHSDGIPIELGAEFIHGHPKEFLDALDAHRMRWYELPDVHYFREGSGWRARPFWDELVETLSSLKVTAGKDEAFSSALDRTPVDAKAKTNARAFVQGFQAAEIDRVSARDMKLSAAGPRDRDARRLEKAWEGYGAFLERVAAPIADRIRLNRQAYFVEWRRGRVKIEARSSEGEIFVAEARQVLVTLPIGVLKARPEDGGVSFHPPLPSHARAIASLEMGQVVKIAMRFNSRFWADEFPGPLGFAHLPGCAFSTWWGSAPASDPILIAWSGGDGARELEWLSEADRVTRALADLARGFGVPLARVKSELREAWQYDWGSDPFSRGAYAFVGIGGENARRVLARSVAHTVYFAGEALHAEKNGTVDGAWESGKKTARRMRVRKTRSVKRDTARFSSASNFLSDISRHFIP